MLSRILEPEVMDSADEADEYDRMDHAEVNQRFVDDFLSVRTAWRAPLETGWVVDVGTGTARIPIVLCSRAKRLSVAAVDMAVAMLQRGQRNVELEGLAARIRLQRASARRLPFRDGACASAISNSLIHHVPDAVPVMREFHRVTAPGGLIFVRDLVRPNSLHELQGLVRTYAGEATSTQRDLFAASLHAALSLDEVRAAAAGLPFSTLSVAQTSDRHWTLIASPSAR